MKSTMMMLQLSGVQCGTRVLVLPITLVFNVAHQLAGRLDMQAQLPR